MSKPRVLILIVAYNAETTIRDVLARVPRQLTDEYDVEALVLDDSSSDRTFEESQRHGAALPFPVHVLRNPVNQGYGGNQKIGYHYAISRRFDFVALLHGDGQYAPECLPDLVRPLRDEQADVVFGSRMMQRFVALRGGMPLYKYVGNRVLTWLQNHLLGTSFSEFHSGYRVYSVAALRGIPFALNTSDFHFDTEIIIQLVLAKRHIIEVPIPTYYGNEICRVNGIKYAFEVSKATLVARLQRMGMFYDRRFDVESAAAGEHPYLPKLGYLSPHTAVFEAVRPGTRVLDLGCAGVPVGAMLKSRFGCLVTGVDRFPLDPAFDYDRFITHDLNDGLPSSVTLADYDYVLLLDVIEHLASPEGFVEQLREAAALAPNTSLLVSTANIGFFINRLMMLFGQFNYGKRGILDLTHTRLFTTASIRRLFEQGGFRVAAVRGIPGPYPLVFGESVVGRALVRLNSWLIRVAAGLFSYQIFLVVQPQPSLDYLLREAHDESVRRTKTA